jgi:mannan endo-1,4-beta-mannosidase
MFWDGERRHPGDRRPQRQPQTRRNRRLRDWFSTAVMALVLVGLVVPSVDAAASTQSARTLLATWSADSKVVVYQETSSQIRYGGRWFDVYDSSYLGGKARAANASKATAFLQFRGAAVSWVGPIGSTRGKAQVYIDGKLATTVNSWSSSFSPSRVLFQKSWNIVGAHTISIVTLGTAGHPTVALDAFLVRLDTGSLGGPEDGAGASIGTLPPDVPGPPAGPTPVPPGLGGAAPDPTPTQAQTPTSMPTPVATPIATPTAAPSATPSPKSPPDSGGFLSRSGTTLTLNGAPHRLIGINMYTALWGDYPYRTDLATALPQLPGVNAVRVFAFQASAIKDGVRDWSSWDASLASFAQRGIKVIMVLTDQWGGQPVTDSPIDRTIGWYQTGYRTTVEGLATYRDWVAEAVTRYRNNPTVGIWQLVNEGEARNPDGTCSETPARDALRAFADDMAGLVKGIDPNHLVSLGTIAGQCGSNVGDYAYINAGPNIDVMDWHDYNYPQAQLGFDDANNGFTVSRDRAIANGKVYIIGELGVPFAGLSTPTTAYRASLLDAKLAAQFAAGSQGELLWCWSDSYNATPPRDMEIAPGDPVLAVLAKY